tara:strand:+ start:15985 stop:16629 length:645 start_codon:yes stop_codon:yes gene_type:complete
MQDKKAIIIGIAGPSASGKSLLASTIIRELGSNKVAVISEDYYYKDLSNIPQHVRKKMNFDHPEALDHKLLAEHLATLQKGDNVEVPQYDHSSHSRLETTKTVGNHSIIVLEGILLFADPILRELMDILIFVDTPLDICFIRRLQRDTIERKRTVDSIINQYTETVRPMYLQFIEPSKKYADIIVPKGGKNRIAIDMIKAKMNELLENYNNQAD